MNKFINFSQLSINPVIKKYIFSYLLIVFFLILTYTVTYVWLFMGMRDMLVENISNEISGSASTIGSVKEEFKNISLAIMKDNELSSLLRGDYNQKNIDYYSLYECKNEIGKYSSTNSNIFSISAISPENDLIVSSVGATTFFYDSEENLNNILYDNFNYIDGNIVYIYDTSVGIDGFNSSSRIEIVLNPSVLSHAFLYVVDTVEGFVNVNDFDNNFIYSSDNNYQNPQSHSNFIIVSKGYPEINQVVTIGIPNSYIFSYLSTVLEFMIISAIVILVFGITFSILLSIKQSSPIISIVNQLSLTNSKGQKDILKMVQSEVSNLILTKEEFNRQITYQQMTMKDLFINRLFTGVLEPEDKFQFSEYLPYDYINSEYIMCNGLIVSNSEQNTIKSEDERTVILLYIKELIVREFKDRLLIRAHSKLIPFSVFSQPNCKLDCEEIKSKLTIISKDVSVRFGIFLQFFIGQIFDDFERMPLKYLKVRELRQYYAGKTQAEVISLDDIELKNDILYYPSELERLFITYCKNADEKRALAFIDEIFERNELINTHYTFGYLKQEISGSFIRVFEELNFITTENLDYQKSLLDIQNYDRYKALVIAKCKEVCAYANKSFEDKKSQTIQCIMDFIKEFYSDSSLSLTVVAQKFSMSDGYVSKLFKKETSQTISSYIETVRLSKATELLCNSTITVTEISELVGYEKINTFYKAFQKHFGESPKKYRESQNEPRQNTSHAIWP